MNRLLNELQKNKMTIIVALPANSVELAKAAQKSGAHAAKTHLNMVHRASKVQFGSLSQERKGLQEILGVADIPMGIVPGATLDVSPEELRELSSMGFDFYDIFCHFMRPQLLEVQGISVMGAVDSSFDIPTIGNLARPPIEMMEIAIIPSTGYGEKLSVVDLARYRQVIEHMHVPAIIPSQRALTPADVPYLYETGAKALLIGVLSVGTDPDSLAHQTSAFREAVEKL